MLNVSRNSVGPELCLDPRVCCPTLRQLNLSFNHITGFPYNLSQVMKNLEELSLEGYDTKCVSFSSVLLCFFSSTKCSYCSDWIVVIRPIAFFSSLVFLRNQISELSLPLSLAEMKVFDVSKNKLTVISDGFLSACTKLETFNASVNNLSKYISL